MSKLMVFSAMAVFLMVADARFHVTAPLRNALATALYPLQWAVLQPIEATDRIRAYFSSLSQAHKNEVEALKRLALQAEKALQLEQMALENRRLRELLAMRERLTTTSMGAQVLYDAADPFSRKLVIDRGQAHGVVAGSPVIDDSGVLGQVTRVYPLMSEVTLLIDEDQAIPVLNSRTGVRSVIYGQQGAGASGLELRYTLANADLSEGDLLTTSGIDGVYPAGLPVARITQVERRAESSFTRISCVPLARVQGALHVLVLAPVGPTLPTPPQPAVVPSGHLSSDTLLARSAP